MQQYLDLIKNIRAHGVDKLDRTGTGTRSIFGHQMRFNLARGFPLVTTKFTAIRLVAVELLWFLRGDTNVKFLQDNNCHIWDEWADDYGNLGPVYGAQWRSWKGSYGEIIDQIAAVIHSVKTDPDGRRHIVSAWNVAELQEMALPPCHAFFQFYVADGRLSCQLYQRSADVFLGVPFNIASYALLTHMIAQVCGLAVGELIWTGGDCHLYNNHVEQVDELLTRTPKPLCELWLNEDITDIDAFTLDDMAFNNYTYWPSIKAPVAV